ncbi:MAG: glycosyltransferase [Candidatus Omnitrophota bacterium]
MPDFVVSIIIPAYNSAKTIAQTIKAVLKQSYPGKKEIIVVDDGSKDNTAQIVREFDQVRYIYQDNSGPATARNHGAKESKGEFLFFTDSDCVPEETWVEKIIPHFQDKTIAVVAGSYGIANREDLLAACIHDEIVYRHLRRMPEFPKSFGSYNFCVRKNVFMEVGGFNEGYRNASGEDNDLSYRVRQAGYRIYFAKNALVMHYHTSSLRKYLFEQYRHGVWRVKMYADHPRMTVGDDYTYWKDIVEIPLVYGAFVLALFFFLPISWPPISLKILVLVLCGIELFSGFWIMRRAKEGLYFSGVMLLRAVARALGFASGLALFPAKKLCKKNK